ncbi:putative transmembrane protein [Sesbania bispinosa]|nr:putative transmembrane protein [Sesbania bispinosa]
MGMAANFSNRRILFTVVVIIFFILVVSSQLGASCRPLQEDQWSREFDGLLLQLLPRGSSRPSSPDSTQP